MESEINIPKNLDFLTNFKKRKKINDIIQDKEIIRENKYNDIENNDVLPNTNKPEKHKNPNFDENSKNWTE